MSTSSSNNNGFKEKNYTDIQGGEKKVMKKSLSVVLTAAMALSMFSSVAFGKTSADFTDLKDLDAATKAKFDALISAGIFDGVSETTFGLKEEMNRAQFAKVAALITGIEVNKDLKTSSFSDVKADDAANGYALPFIEALKTAGITDGYGEGTYNPAGKVTKEQLATFLVRVLGKDADAKGKTGTDATVTDWAQGYVALALELKLLSNGADGKFGGTSNATRDLLLTGAYEAKAQYVSPGKVSVSEAKATGVQQVTVSFNKPVDDTKAKVALTKGSLAVATTAKFAADKKSVVLTLTTVKLTEGSYTATLSGLDAANVDKTTATFTAENEKVTKLSFVNASDKIPQAANLVLSIKAENQYGENATLNGGNYSVFPSTSGALTRNADTGYLDLKVNTSDLTLYPTEIGVLPVTVSLNQSAISVSKTFKIGTKQLVSKVELKDAVYTNGKTALSSEGDQATFDITRYDQYGFKMVDDASTTITPVITPTDMNILDKKVEDNKLKVTVASGKKVDKTADYTVTYYDTGASATGKLSLKAASVPTKLEFGTFTGTIADGDTADKFIPIVAYDAEGKQLSAQDIVDNSDSISFTVSGASVGTGPDVTSKGIVKYGENKGKLKINNVVAKERGVVYLYMSIYNANIQTQAQLPLTVVAARTPESVVLSGTTEPAKKALNGATTTYKVLVKDQYGENLDTTTDGYTVKANIEGATSSITIGGVAITDGATYVDLKGKVNDKEIKFTAGSTLGKTTLKFTITKNVGGAEISTPFKRTVEVIENKDLTYSANTLSDLFAIQTNDKAKSTTSDSSVGSKSKFAKGVAVTVKDKAGDTVAVPDALKEVKTAYVVDSNIATVTPAGKVLGQRVGTTTVTAVVYKANGETQDFTYTANVKADLPVVATLTADANATYSSAKDIEQLINAKVVDNYGVEYKYVAGTTPADDVNYIKTYNDFFGVQYIISNVQGGGTAKVVDGKIVLSGGTVNEFVLKAVSSNGKTTTTLVTVPVS
ncbi:S-layer homology domain-containing protein [Paenibacillus qinlingensis]|uniref:S-layer homology domain-containing protein n=1 Tax=Paenibacillus qinlingensis TaxID=1837343 RepID=UPI001566D796|nr:S-layer homology domain-containing protein [Paenibacillus qinlingensis]NQX61945.1 S-layer homology domain-containing protein [Paenibacillus qinlingensis]